MTDNAADTEDDDNDDDGSILTNLFIDKNYKLQTLTFHAATPSTFLVTCNFYALQSATTAFDLTGQIVWPGVHVLSSYLVSTASEGQHLLLANKQCIELGAGAGVISVLASQLGARSVIATDHNDEVLSMLRRTAALHQQQQSSSTSSSCDIEVRKLEWNDSDDSIEDMPQSQVILGSDICYSLDSVRSLFTTIGKLLRRGQLANSSTSTPAAICILSYIERWRTVTAAMHEAVSTEQLVMRQVDVKSFVHQANLRDDAHLFIITLR